MQGRKIPAACAGVCNLLGDAQGLLRAETTRFVGSVPTPPPTNVDLPGSLQAGSPLFFIETQVGDDMSNQHFFSKVTENLANITGPIRCTPVQASAYSALWSTIKVDNVLQQNCNLRIVQNAVDYKNGSKVPPPTLSCTTPAGANEDDVAAQVATAVANTISNTPEFNYIAPKVDVDEYLNRLLQSTTAGQRFTRCTMTSLQFNSVDMSNNVFSYAPITQCLRCLQAGEPQPLPTCVSISQTLPHPVVRCMQAGLDFQQADAPSGGGGGGGGGAPSTSKGSSTNTLLIGFIALIVVGVLAAIVTIAVSSARGKHADTVPAAASPK